MTEQNNNEQEEEKKEPQKKEAKTEQTAENAGNGDKSASLKFLDDIREERQKLSSEREGLKRDIEELRQLRAEQIVSGTSSGNVPVKKKEDDPISYADKALKGELDIK